MARALIGSIWKEDIGTPWMRTAAEAGVLADRRHILGIGSYALDVATKARVVEIVPNHRADDPVAIDTEIKDALDQLETDLSRETELAEFAGEQALAGIAEI